MVKNAKKANINKIKKSKNKINRFFEEPKINFNAKNITIAPIIKERIRPNGLILEIKANVIKSSKSFEKIKLKLRKNCLIKPITSSSKIIIGDSTINKYC